MSETLQEEVTIRGNNYGSPRNHDMTTSIALCQLFHGGFPLTIENILQFFVTLHKQQLLLSVLKSCLNRVSGKKGGFVVVVWIVPLFF